ncbi:MAG: NAD(P)-binding protein [Woeseiaceae bacterium]|nr:NAD(P)-binding protein [Woeseiaceae bacterium]
MSKAGDRDLGMHRAISRRDVLHGIGAIAASSLTPGKVFADKMLAAEKAGAFNYPPALTGMRGSHPGSFEIAHALAREGKRDWGPVEDTDEQQYDLVVVGAGISGLAAAYFYRQSNPGARILILDNHDDFGGHAKRNEFTINGKTLIGYGGSQTMEAPSGYSGLVKSLLKDIGVRIDRFDSAYDDTFFREHGLAGSVFFNKTDWGVDRLVRYDLSNIGSYLPLASSNLSDAAAVAQMPMSEPARQQLLHLLTTEKDVLPNLSFAEKEEYLSSISYREFLQRHLGITEDEVFKTLQALTTDMSVGIETASAAGALFYLYLPAVKAIGVDFEDIEEPYIHHFPDGNASVARLLVRELIPGVAPGSTMEDIVTARFDYGKLDTADTKVRLRLNSTVTHVENDSGSKSASRVNVSYVRDGRAYRVHARHTVLACYNAIIPSLCPELPESQRAALANQVKAPILYTTVALNNWRAWKKLGIGAVASSGSYHTLAMLDFPVNLGDYRFSQSPDEPIAVHMERFPHAPNSGFSKREQRRVGRHELFATPFETIERNVRQQLATTLADGGFDPASDIEAITVNRWAHGYSWMYDWDEQPYYEDWNDERYPHVQARKPFGRIAIANCDAGARAMMEVAIEQAWRAVGELTA